MMDNEHNEAVLEHEPGDAPHAEPAAAGDTPSAKLIVKRSGAETDIEFPVNPPAIIGRFDPTVGPIDVDLGHLQEGSYVSRKHAKITCEEGVWKIHDMGSSNGTFVLRGDFERVEEAELADGMEFALGNARFVFKAEGAVASDVGHSEPQAEPHAEADSEPHDAPPVAADQSHL